MAQTIEQQEICMTSQDAIERISACNALIETQRLLNGQPIPPKILGVYYAQRAEAYESVSDFERAIAGYERGLQFFPDTQDKIDRVKVKASWLRLLEGHTG